jgi:Flp pilus assembly protein TadG
MGSFYHWRRWIEERRWRDETGAQIVEFAVSLPLLIVFVVGIFDFSGAFTLKQKLANAARDAARVAAADPATDLSVATPMSVKDAFQVAHNYLIANNINDCGLTQSGSPTGLTWTYTATNGPPPCSITLTINRGYYFPQNSTTVANCTAPPSPTGQTAVVSTCVSIQYGYQWRFSRVVSLVGGSAVLPSNITTTAVALNEN